MYTIPVEIRESTIDGKGVFTTVDIPDGTIVWQYTEGDDTKISQAAFNAFDEASQIALQRIAYLSPSTHLWVSPPENDPACYTNHDEANHNTSVVYDENISDEPLFISNRNIRAGEEITNNYLEFDENSTPENFGWLKH